MVDERAVVVARRAAEMALAAGVELPDDLALWRLAGGRPPAEARAGEPEELGTLLEGTIDAHRRQATGAHYTPAPLATALVARALAGHECPVVGDPACGGGALLLAAARHLEAAGLDRQRAVFQLWGADLDAVAAATTEAALTLWAGARVPPRRFVPVDALTGDLAWPLLDVAVGNPPFLTPLAAHAARSVDEVEELRTRFGTALLPYTDSAALFLLRACRLVRVGGTVAMVQPRSVLAARDADGVRRSIREAGCLVDVVLPEQPGFAAAVDVCIPVIEVGPEDTGIRWSEHLARALGVPAVALAGASTIGDVAEVTAGFRSEFYGLAPHVHEADDLGDGQALVTTGLVDLGTCAWGERPARVAGRTWDRPVVDVAALDGRAAAWVARTGGPKLIVAPQTKVVEVVVDEVGAWIAGVPLVVVLAPADQLWPLAAALAAPAVTAWLLARSAGTARSAGALKVTAAALREVPLPTDDVAWARGTAAFRSGDLDAFAEAMSAAYGTDADVTAWWLPRARTVWSPAAARR